MSTDEQVNRLIEYVNCAIEKAVCEAKDSDSLSTWAANEQLRRAEEALREAFSKEPKP